MSECIESTWVRWCNARAWLLGDGIRAQTAACAVRDETSPGPRGSAFLIYTLVEVDGMKGRHSFTLSVLLFIYCLIVTIVYLTIKEPLFHQCAYALMVFTMFASSF